MQRFHQFLFVASLLVLSWLLMMGVHELGHVVGAAVTGGTIRRVVLHPLAISRTELAANPHPGVVVWLGPVVGCVFPPAVYSMVARRQRAAGKVAGFVAGFCLVANGVYFSMGSFNGVGDCGEMLRTGTPQWVLLGFGAVMISVGLYMWHGLGSLTDFLRDPSIVTPGMAYGVCGVLVVVVAGGLVVSAR